MDQTDEKRNHIQVRVYGFLRKYMDENNLGYVFEKSVPKTGITPEEVAESMSLPLEKVEAVFCNGKIISLVGLVFPGDRVAFFPHGTPGPYRVFLGIYGETQKRKEREGK
jgi:hypothetical protein